MLDSGTLNATITGAETLDYQSTAVWLSDSPINGVHDSFLAGSQLIEGRPTPRQYFLSLRLAKTLVPGTYPISVDSSVARVTFINGNNGLSAFRAINGQVTIDEMPQGDPLTGKLRAAFTCEALNDDNVQTVSINNGKVNIEK